MGLVDANDLAMMRTAQVESLMDTCVLMRYTAGSANEYGVPDAPTWVADSSSTACGFQPSQAREAMGETQVTIRPARLRLPVGTVIDARDRVKITYRHGEALSVPWVFQFIGNAEQGPSGLLLTLQTVPASEVRDGG